MRKPTTTQQLNTAITNNLLHLTKTEIYHKSTGQTETIDSVKFKEYFDSLCKSGIFADAIGWHFERDHSTRQYVAECSRMNGDSDIIVIAHLCVNDGVSIENVERTLKIEEE